MEVEKVDVNEQNEQAVGFYQHYGFKIEQEVEISQNAFPSKVYKLRKL